jgi:Holliday junction resolvase
MAEITHKMLKNKGTAGIRIPASGERMAIAMARTMMSLWWTFIF